MTTDEYLSSIGLTEELMATKVELGDAVTSGPGPNSDIGHVVEIGETGYLIYYAGSERYRTLDGLTVKRARRSYLRKYNELEKTE